MNSPIGIPSGWEMRLAVYCGIHGNDIPTLLRHVNEPICLDNFYWLDWAISQEDAL